MAAALASSGGGHRQDEIFLSLFPRINFTTPTPEATPNIGTISSPGQPFGGFNVPGLPDDAVRSNRAWSAATRYLALPPGLEGKAITLDHDTVDAFRFLLDSPTTFKGLVRWYTNEMDVHLRHFVWPELEQWQQPVLSSNALKVLQSTITLLQRAKNHYLGHWKPLSDQVRKNALGENTETCLMQIKRNMQTLVLHATPRQRLQQLLTDVMYRQMKASLPQDGKPEKCAKSDHCQCKVSLDGLPLRGLSDVGIGGLTAERAFAHAVHKLLQGPAIERRCFEVDWNGHASVIPKLRQWIQQSLVPVMEEALGALTGKATQRLSQNDVQQLISMAVANLGRLRTLSLFDYVKSWPASTGAILDIWEYLNAGDKAHVCQSFSDQIQRRLLHAGASTSEILSMYVNVIHAFKSLDSRGVLLEKVAVPIRNYLRARDDTVGIIAASFLADVDADGNVTAADMDKVCPDITIEVANSTVEDSRDSKTLNWDDMSWIPDPIDAGPDYKSSKSEDVVAYILGLFERDEFIKEVTNVLAQHLLLTTDTEYVKETRLVELFKSRLDATKLQAAEVMLKDMRDSVNVNRRVNPHYKSNLSAAPTPREIQAAIPEEGITLSSLYRRFEKRMKRPQFLAAVNLVANKRDDLFYAKRTRIPQDPSDSASKKNEEDTKFTAQILSSFFWPQLRSNQFDMPEMLDPLRVSFNFLFDRQRGQRKLKFRPALGRISLRLDLEDRTVEETDIPAWRASVIDTFASERLHKWNVPAVQYEDAVGLTVEQLMQGLRMEEELVRDALNYWTNRNVLYQRAPGVYAVLERLDMLDVQPQSNRQPEETISAVKSQDAMLRESAPMFETFIANMLRNQGPKEIGGMMGITGLLKMVLPTFTYGDDEVRWLLSEMEGRGEVERNGDMWSVVQ